MTRLAVLADLHGNLPALEAVQRDLAQFTLDQVVVAGDVINWGPFSAQVAQRVLDEGWAVIRGNNEFYRLDYQTPRAPAAWDDPLQYPLLPWLKEQLPGRWPGIIGAWPDELRLCFPDAPVGRVTHGSPRGHSVSLYPDAPESELVERLGPVEESLVIAGHTHLPMDRLAGRVRVLNPGAVGVALDGRPGRARYMLLESQASGWQAVWREVRFDLEPVWAEFARQGFVERCGVLGELVLDEFRSGRVAVLPYLNWCAAEAVDDRCTPASLARFRQVDWRLYAPPEYQLAQA